MFIYIYIYIYIYDLYEKFFTGIKLNKYIILFIYFYGIKCFLLEIYLKTHSIPFRAFLLKFITFGHGSFSKIYTRRSD